MPPRPALLLALLVPFAIPSRAVGEPVLRDRYTVQAGGADRDFVLATDEAVRVEAGGARTRIALNTKDARSTGTRLRELRAAGGEIQPVLYEEGKARTDYTRALVTRRVLLRTGEGVDVRALAAESGLRVVPSPVDDPTLVLLEAADPERALAAMESLRGKPGVQSADVQLARQRQKKLVPNDPLFPDQWHLRNAGQKGGAWWIDLRATDAWDEVTGAGVTLAILDDGLQYTHPDLQANYNGALDFDYNGNDGDPAPGDLVNDSHGTACAGVAAARGGNGIGVSGVAPDATLTGIRLIAAPNTDQDEANAFALHNDLIHVKSNSWGTPDDGLSVEGPGPLGKAALVAGVTSGRGGKGTIYLFAAGNGLDVEDNSNYDGYANAIQVIAVGAVNDFGFQAYYGEPGANIAVCAPSNGGGHNRGIVTTDLVGEDGDNNAGEGTRDLADRSYTRTFGGSSSACPAVAGVVALMLEANPNLGWRDVKEILILTARPVHTTDPDWSVNGAGLPFNHKYGAGMVDAQAAVTVARTWQNLPAETVIPRSQTGSISIPDANATGVTRTLAISDANFRVEQVELLMNLTHSARGDLEIILTSPSGMQSRLAEPHNDGGDNYASWTFTSMRHWGESAQGNWTVKVADREPGDVGTFGSFTLRLHGTTQAGPRLAGATATLAGEGNLPANGVADPGEAVTFSLGLRNIGATATSALSATLLPLGGVTAPGAAQAYGTLTAGGAAVPAPFAFRAEGSAGTRVKALLHLTDGATNLGYAALSIPLGKSSTVQSTAGGSITLADNQPASPSPSAVSVSGIAGRVHDLSVALTGYTHPYPDDLGLLLSGPDGLQIQLHGGGGNAPLSSASITFSDHAPTFLPLTGPVASGTYRPRDLYGSDRPMSQDPVDEPAFTLGEFNGVPANGTWNLYAEDFAAEDFGSLGGWRLNFTVLETTDNLFFVGPEAIIDESSGTAQVRIRRTGGHEGAATVQFATSNLSALSGSDYTAVSGTFTFAVGELEKVLSIPLLNDGSLEPDESFRVTLSNPTGNSTLGASVVATVTLRDGDRDGDTLPDDYETANGLDPDLASDALLDGDGDGYSNREEYELGTLPGDAGSALLLRASFDAGVATVIFPSVIGRIYTIERSPLPGPPWTVLAQDLAGTGGNLEHADTDPARPDNGFYRVTGRPASP